MANWEGIKLKRKWPKIVNGVVEANPTPIPTFEGTVEQILPSSSYIPFKKFSLGNLHWRLKLVCAYLLLKFDQDPNSYAESIPENYAEKDFSIEDIEAMCEDIEKFANEHHRRKGNTAPVSSSIANEEEQSVDEVESVNLNEDENGNPDENVNSDEIVNEEENLVVDDNIDICNNSEDEIDVVEGAATQLFANHGSNAEGEEGGCSRTMPNEIRKYREAKAKNKSSANQVHVAFDLPDEFINDLNDDDFLLQRHDSGTPDNSDTESISKRSSRIVKNAILESEFGLNNDDIIKISTSFLY